MISLTRRSSFAAFAAMLAAPVVARAQGATNAPAGGIPSSTAPSNSAGTPAGGTGVISTTRPMGGTAPMASSPNTPMVGGEMGTSETAPRRRRRHRTRRAHRTTTTTPQ